MIKTYLQKEGLSTRLGGKAVRAYDKAAHAGGRAEDDPRTPRLRLSRVAMAKVFRRKCGKPPWQTDAIFDESQSITQNSARVDGLIPTFTRSARMFSYKLGRVLEPIEHYVTMGFQVGPGDLADFSEHEQYAMIGNSQHIAVVGTVCTAVLLACDKEI